jgi:hypothetical protein
MKVEVIQEWSGTRIGVQMELPDDLAKELIKQKKVKALDETQKTNEVGSMEPSNQLVGSKAVSKGSK